MTHIRIHVRGDGCEIPDGKWFLVVVSEDIDGDGNWIPFRMESLNRMTDLQHILKRYLDTGDKVVIRASGGFSTLATKLGLPLLVGEWGVV